MPSLYKDIQACFNCLAILTRFKPLYIDAHYWKTIKVNVTFLQENKMYLLI